MQRAWKFLQRMAKQEQGQSLVEYGLIIALIAVAVVMALVLLGGHISNLFTSVTNNL
ncbi:MAG: Flp family type IVb pilin [Alicyclobacillus sp.]|nr:Flp family type IVb pilin [Alicyclobacillus sp.]